MDYKNLWFPSPQQLSPEYWRGTKAELAAQSEAVGLPLLVGSYRQVSWAETLRVQFIIQAGEVVRTSDNPEQSTRFLGGVSIVLASRIDAAWWIESREDDLSQGSTNHTRKEAIDEAIPLWDKLNAGET